MVDSHGGEHAPTLRVARTTMLDQCMTDMPSLPGVWCPTCAALPRSCLQHFPPPRGCSMALCAALEAPCTMPWKDGSPTSDERSLTAREVVGPDGHQCAGVLVVALSVARGPEGMPPSDLRTAASPCGTQGGIHSLLDGLQRCNMTATSAVPAVIAAISPAHAPLHLAPSLWQDHPGSLR
jgi:hypothetical protein